MFTPDPNYVVAPTRNAYEFGGPYLSYNPTNESVSRFALRRPATWEAGYVTLSTIDWACTNNTNNFKIIVNIELYTEGASLNVNGGASMIASFTQSPATIETKQTTILLNISDQYKVNINKSYSWIAVSIMRDGTDGVDTNAGYWNLLGCTIQYVETQRYFGEKVPL